MEVIDGIERPLIRTARKSAVAAALLRLMAIAAICIGASAGAQYVATTTNGVPYPALTSSQPITLISNSGTAADRGRAVVQLGFTFPYYNKTYTQLTVTANGVLFFEPSSALNASSDFFGNFALPNVAEPNAMLAPFWDDLEGKNPGSQLRQQAVSGANGQGLAIEFSDWSLHFGTYSLTFQVRIWQNGIVEFFYGPMVGSGATPSATVGIEDPTGGIAVQGKTCGASCALGDFQENQLIRFGPAPGPDLSVVRLQVNSIVPSGNNLQVSTTLAMRNFGSQAANNFTYRLFLSDDTQYQPGVDAPITPAPSGPFTIAALSSLADTKTGTVPRPAMGSFYVLAVVDDANVVAESNEQNNLASNGVPLAAGVDLVAEDIVGPPLGGPGDTVSVTVQLSNQGIDPAGSVPVKIRLSDDNVLDPSDLVVWQGTISVAGGQNVSQPVSFALAGTVPAGEYLFILQIDDGPAAGVISEVLDTNNVKVGSQRFTVKQADLIVESVSIHDPLPPYLQAPAAYFGEQIRLEAIVKNIGGASAPNTSVAFYLSDNETLNGVTDTFVANVSGVAVPAGASVAVNVTAAVPTRKPDLTPLQPGLYYFFAAAIGQNLTEVTTGNNFLRTGATRVRNPSADLTATNIRGPALAGAGESFALTRTLTNIGNRPATNVRYRFYLSANTIITADDVPLKITTSTGLVDSLSVNLNVGQKDVRNEIVEVPAGTPAATYYVGVLVDTENSVDEVNEDNNGVAGEPVQVVADGFGLSGSQLPDGIVGLSYRAELGAVGTDGMAVYSLETGSMLPPGLSMSMQGVISGTPTEAGVWPINFRVTSGTNTAASVRVLRVSPLTASLAINTTTLPPAARNLGYEARFGAVGGVAPYAWSVDSGQLLTGLQLETDGRLVGSPLAALGTSASFTVRVRDALGNTDTKAFLLTVVDSTALLIVSSQLAPAAVGSDYVVDVVAENASGAPLSKPLTWSVVLGLLPPGLKLQPADDRVLITGTPSSAGIYAFTLQVEDARGRADTADFIMQVFSPAVQVRGLVPDEVLRGTEVEQRFSAVGPVPDGVRWVVRDGVLPPGLSLDETGELQGRVSDDAELGRYSFTVGPSANGTIITYASYSMSVVTELSGTGRGCGCTGSGAELGGVAVALVVSAVSRRRRRAP